MRDRRRSVPGPKKPPVAIATQYISIITRIALIAVTHRRNADPHLTARGIRTLRLTVTRNLMLDWKGQKFYFIGEETRQEFAKQNQIALDSR